MTSATPWHGTKRVAFVPLYRSNAAPPDEIPPNWENVILNRVINNPRPEANGADRSLRAWLHYVSWGRADIDPLVLPMQTIDRQNVLPGDLDGIPCEQVAGITCEGVTFGEYLRNQGVHAAQLVMLGQRPSGISADFWSRVVMAESNGVWLMELMHSLTDFVDLYPFANDTDPVDRNIGAFDEMSAASQTHPTAFTKNELGWLPPQNIGRYQIGTSHSVGFILQFVSYADPHVEPFHGESFVGIGTRGVRIGDDFPYVMVEARKKNDQFEAGMPSTGDPQEMGIASEGVIAYRVQIRDATNNVREGGKTPLYLLTQMPLQVGQSTVLDNGVQLKVTGETPKAFIVQVFETPPPPPPPPLVLPNFYTWWWAGEVKPWLQERGLNWETLPHFVSDGWVKHQSPGPGSTVAVGDTVRLTLSNDPQP
jgi:hypothetical protein